MADRTNFGHNTTTDEVLEGIDLSGIRAVVTGGASGIGTETCRALASKGAEIVIPARTQEKGDEAAKLIKESVPNARVDVLVCDLSNLSSIRAFAEVFNSKYDRIDLLINNAGVMACPFSKTADGFEMQFGTNHLGHFLLTNLLMEPVKKGQGRIVNLSSLGHQMSDVDFDDPNFENREYQSWVSYGQSKTANILFTVELDKRLRNQGVRAYALHPGTIVTNLGRHMTAEDFEFLQNRAKERGQEGGMKMKSVEAGAATTCYAATAPELSDKGGIYLEDCHIAELSTDPKNGVGVLAYALDENSAGKLWSLSEKLVGESFNP